MVILEIFNHHSHLLSINLGHVVVHSYIHVEGLFELHGTGYKQLLLLE